MTASSIHQDPITEEELADSLHQAALSTFSIFRSLIGLLFSPMYADAVKSAPLERIRCLEDELSVRAR